LALIFLCCAAAWFADHSLSIRKAIITEREEALLSLQKEEITAFTLYGTRETIRLEKQAEGWRIKQPAALDADPDHVDAFLTNLGAARKYDPVRTRDLEQYGLDFPKVRITVEGSQPQRSETLAFGVESTTRGRWFAMIEGGEAVFTVPSHIRNIMNNSAMYFREKRIFTGLRPGDVREVEVRQGEHSFRMTRSSAGTWELLEPLREQADEAGVQALLEAFISLQALTFLDDAATSAARKSLERPEAVVLLNGDAVGVLEIGGPTAEGQAFVARGGSWKEAFVIPAEFTAFLKQGAAGVRSRVVIPWKTEDIRKIRVIAGDSYAAIERDMNGTWRMEDEPDKAVDQGRARRLLADLLSLKKVSLESDAPTSLALYGLEAPRARVIAYHRESDKMKIVLSFGDKAPDRDICYARTGEDQVFGVDWTEVGALYVTRRELLDRRLFPLEAGEIGRVEWRVKENRGVLERSVKEGWTVRSVTAGRPREIPAVEAEAILAVLKGLEYEKEVTGLPPERAAEILASGAHEIGLFTLDGKPAASIRTGPFEEQDVVVQAGDGRVFLVKRSALEALITMLSALLSR
ncbi:MAG TPA: DUF4340 domain-containing protein, partial [Candidatus Sumerlaeota bacterium]|nr:DUF4340 domain-containing protein [Candidatus Sumerlaeota bacterium]